MITEIFKADVDDIRDSLSFRLSKILKFNGAEVYCSDEFASSDNFISKEELISKSETIIIGAPHKTYDELEIPSDVDFVNIWK